MINKEPCKDIGKAKENYLLDNAESATSLTVMLSY